MEKYKNGLLGLSKFFRLKKINNTNNNWYTKSSILKGNKDFTGNSQIYGRSKLWFKASGALEAKLLKPGSKAVSSICVAARGNFLYSACLAVIISSGLILLNNEPILKINKPASQINSCKTNTGGPFSFCRQ